MNSEKKQTVTLSKGEYKKIIWLDMFFIDLKVKSDNINLLLEMSAKLII